MIEVRTRLEFQPGRRPEPGGPMRARCGFCGFETTEPWRFLYHQCWLGRRPQ